MAPAWLMRTQPADGAQDPYTRPPPSPKNASRRAARRLSAFSTIVPVRNREPRAMKQSQEAAPRQMPAKLNIARFVIYAAVLLWSIIVLAIAIHLHGILQSSDLTVFVPFAIFVSIASLLIFSVLLGVSLWKRHASPISTRIELGCLGLAGTLWIALGAFMASSDAQLADVECYASEEDTDPIDVPGFSTETFQAQYRVIEAFSLFNAILIWGFLIFLTFMVLRQHVRGNSVVWSMPVTALPWASTEASKLPAPVTAQRSQSHSRSPRTPREKDYAYDSDKRGRPARRPSERTAGGGPSSPASTPGWSPGTTPGSTPRGHDQRILWMPHMPRDPPQVREPPPARTYRPAIYDNFQRSASPRRPEPPRRKDTWGRDASPRR